MAARFRGYESMLNLLRGWELWIGKLRLLLGTFR
jgi:hypothetical protein